MRASTTRKRPWTFTVTALFAATAMLLAGCQSGTDDSGDNGTTAAKDTVRYALGAGTGPNWILPLSAPDKMATHNHALKAVLWAPLFEFDGTSGTMEWDQRASAAKEYKFSEDRLQVTITLHDLDWSDGKPVTSRDVEFWYNLARFNSEKMGGYSAGNIPDNIVGFETVDEKNFTLTFDKVYNEDFLLANQLTLAYPMPQHVWDKTSDTGAIGDHDRTEADAIAVYDYLFKQAEDMATYDSNPLWQVVSGPYTVKKWTDAGQVELARNSKYTGTDKATIENVIFMPFTSTDAEMNVAQSGDLDYGYITSAKLESKQQFIDLGYEIKPWKGWSITYMPYNFANPTMGPVYKQLYVRQALQHAIDQESISKVIWKGAAEPGYGPIPQQPETDFLSSEQKDNPYPFDLKKSEKLFADNGWTKNGEVLECTSPGAAAGQCGEGVTAGQQMEIKVLSQNGSQETDNMMAELQSSFSKIGVKMILDTAPVDSVTTEAQKCKVGSDCTWELVFFGTAGSWYFPAYPTGERVFAKETKWNAGQYDNPEAEALINQMTSSTDADVAQKYSSILANDLPVMWMPNPVYQISIIKSGLDIGGEQDPGASFYPQRWSWK